MKKYVNTDCNWKSNSIKIAEIDEKVSVKRIIPITTSILRALEIKKYPPTVNKPFTWDRINRRFRRETGFPLTDICMRKTGCSYGALNSQSDVVDAYKHGGDSWYGFKNGSNEQEKLVAHYISEIDKKGEKQVIKELFAIIGNFANNVSINDIKANLDKQDARNEGIKAVRNGATRPQAGTGKKAFSEKITSRGNAQSDYQRFKK